MLQEEKQKRAPVLNPIDRVSEIIFGLIMALSFTGAATASREEIRTVLFAALGCNLAWGLVDGVMYLVSLLTERTRNLMHGASSASAPWSGCASDSSASVRASITAIAISSVAASRNSCSARRRSGFMSSIPSTVTIDSRSCRLGRSSNARAGCVVLSVAREFPTAATPGAPG